MAQDFSLKAARSLCDKSTGSTAVTVEERARETQKRYGRRLEDQLAELADEHLASSLSEDERKELLTEVIQEALLEVVKACQEVATNSALPEGKVVAELIGKRFLLGPVLETRPELP